MPGMGLNFQSLASPHTCFSFLPECALSTGRILDLLRSAGTWGPQSPQPWAPGLL